MRIQRSSEVRSILNQEYLCEDKSELHEVSKASRRSQNQTAEVLYIPLADISIICDKSIFHSASACIAIHCRVCWFGFFFNLHGGAPLKYLIPIRNQSKRTLEIIIWKEKKI